MVDRTELLPHPGSSPFDLSQAVSEARLKKLMDNGRQLDAIGHWYATNLTNYYAQGGVPEDFDFSPVADYSTFPGKIDPRYISHRVPVELSSYVAGVINAHPSFILTTPRLSSPAERLSRMAPLDPTLQKLYANKPLPPPTELKLAQAREWSKLLGLDPSTPFEHISALADSLEPAKNMFARAAYLRLVVDWALDCIVYLAPELVADYREVIDSTILIRSQPDQSNKKKSYAGLFSCGNKYILKLPYGNEEDPINPNHAQRVVTSVHELTHGYVLKTLGILPTEPGFASRYKDTFTQLEEKRSHFPAGNLEGTIQEALAMTMEYLVVQEILTETQDDYGLGQIRGFAESRAESLVNNARYFSHHYREKVGHGDKTPADSKGFAYPDGASLAKALFRLGWTVRDIPQLIGRTKTIVGIVTGRHDPLVYEEIGISRDPHSDYQRILRGVRALKKE